MQITTTDDVLEVMKGYTASAAVNAALELGLFWLLAHNPATADDVAWSLGIPVCRCRYWLEVLVEMELLLRTEKIYSVSPATRAAILDVHSQAAWSFYGAYWRERSSVVVDLTAHMQQKGSVWTVQGREPPNEYQRLKVDADWAARFTQAGYEFHQDLAREVTAVLDMTGVHRMIDLGGGSGVVSLALLECYPQLSSTVIDVEHVCTAGRRIADTTSLADRISYYPADFVADELPTGFDLALECDVGIYELDLFRKIYTSLNANGRLVLVAPWAPGTGLPPLGQAKSSFLGTLQDPEFQFTETASKQALLAEAGFSHFNEWTLSNGRFLLEAQKGSTS